MRIAPSLVLAAAVPEFKARSAGDGDEGGGGGGDGGGVVHRNPVGAHVASLPPSTLPPASPAPFPLRPPPSSSAIKRNQTTTTK